MLGVLYGHLSRDTSVALESAVYNGVGRYNIARQAIRGPKFEPGATCPLLYAGQGLTWGPFLYHYL